MKRIIAFLTLVALLAGTTASLHAWSWANGWDRFAGGNAPYVALAGSACACAGAWYLDKNPYKAKEQRIADALTTLENESNTLGDPGPHRTSTVENYEFMPTLLSLGHGHERRRTVDTIVEDEAARARRKIVVTINSLADLATELTQDEYRNLAAVKEAYNLAVSEAYNRAVANSRDDTVQGETLGALRKEINKLRQKYPTNTTKTSIAWAGIGIGAICLLYGIVEFIDGAR